MKKRKPSGLSARGRQTAKSARPTPDSKIDFSDAPEATDEQLEEGLRLRRARLLAQKGSGTKRAGRPITPFRKQAISIRVSPAVLAKIREIAKKKEKGYQTVLHEILEKATRGETA
jgi:uncharacterized protein (DUF4415 family)